ncbi:MAG: response regulator [Melioribacteraceae bacterium]|jgi:CheY-like chemotaxis protein|nr:response regulator [Melioribacteraceae bacterium]RJP57969.1 MAG: response regulator [Ignavibacteriales bacterium]WKZ69806.1 MAG: response regulator [Melioribacteraceae bacterium]
MKTRILIIEDNLQNMYMLSYLLESENYQVLQAFSGKDGIAIAINESPDVILLDIQLPQMDGYQVAAELRKQDSLKNIPIIAVTSYAMPGDREKALESGATGYIEKPINPDTFISQMISFLPKELHQKDES